MRSEYDIVMRQLVLMADQPEKWLIPLQVAPPTRSLARPEYDIVMRPLALMSMTGPRSL